MNIDTDARSYSVAQSALRHW